MTKARQRFWLIFFGTLVTAGLVLYSQTSAFTWDEGFHLLAAQLIQRGKQPYLDFCFPQAPLNAYWNAAWMALTGDGWRVPHAVAALLSGGSVLLTGQFLWSRFPDAHWRFPGALAAGLMLGLNTLVMQFGTIAQAYAICLFLSVAAFRVACIAVERRNVLWAAAAGLFASAAAASSLLSAPVAPVLWLWILIYDSTGQRLVKGCAFALASVVPILPMVRLFVAGPQQVFFNLLQYHLLFRRVEWEDATRNDIDVLTSWINSSEALLIGALAIAGLWWVARSAWVRPQKAEYALCFALSLALILQESTAHPTFARYFVLVVPFAAILASAGLSFAAARAGVPARFAVSMVALLMILGVGRALFDEHGDFHWQQFETIAARVDAVTPRDALVWSDEQIYFLTRRTPPPGMEFAFGHKLSLAPDQERLYHLLSRDEMQRQLLAKKYATAVSCAEEDDIDKLQLPRLYAMRTKFPECSVFYQLR